LTLRLALRCNADSRLEMNLTTMNVIHGGAPCKLPARWGTPVFPPHCTGKLGNVDSRNLSVAVVLAMLDRWGIELCEGVACLRRSEARNLRRKLFGSRGTRIVPRGGGQMAFELFDGLLYLAYESPPVDWNEPSYVRLHVVERGAAQ
jgi:hypothetical protein